MQAGKHLLLALVVGTAFGVALGMLNGAMALWLTLGCIAGLAYGLVMSRRAARQPQPVRKHLLRVKE